jgi:hypothetical protein
MIFHHWWMGEALQADRCPPGVNISWYIHLESRGKISMFVCRSCAMRHSAWPWFRAMSHSAGPWSCAMPHSVGSKWHSAGSIDQTLKPCCIT